MPLWRKAWIKTTESLDINDMPDDFHRLLWLMLPLICCREGRGMDNPAWIKAKAMPLRMDVGPKQVETAVSWYAVRQMLTRYEVNGRRYFQLHNWHKYQGATDREAASDYPAPPSCEADASSITPVATSSRPTPDLLTNNASTDVDVDVDVEEKKLASASADYQSIRAVYIECFPDKPQPRATTQGYISRTKTRMKDAAFAEKWETALRRVGHSSLCHRSSWFDIEFFLKNDVNWEKCLNGKYDDDKPKGRDGRPRPKQKFVTVGGGT